MLNIINYSMYILIFPFFFNALSFIFPIFVVINDAVRPLLTMADKFSIN